MNVTIHREWKSEPDGINDQPIDVFYNGSWLPAFFSDLKQGDFFLTLKATLEPDLCFMALSDVKRIVDNGVPSFLCQGFEVVQKIHIPLLTVPLFIESSLLINEVKLIED